MIRTIKDKTRKRVFNTDFVKQVKFMENGNMLTITMISGEVNHINGKVLPNNFRFTCKADSDRGQIERFFAGSGDFDFLEVKNDKTLEFKNV